MKEKITLVFLSGWATDQGVWVNQEEYFSSYRKIYNNYHRNIEPFSITELETLRYRDSALKIIKEERNLMILVGWSLGAMVALELEALASEKILGIILVGGTAKFISEDGYDAGLPGVVVDRMKKKLARNPEQTLEDFYTLMFTKEEHSEGFLQKFQQQLLAPVLNWSYLELQAGLDYLKNQDLRILLKSIKVPTLIIHGERDEICPIQAGQNLHTNIEGSIFKLLPGCGHVPFISRAEDFNKEVARWIHGFY